MTQVDTGRILISRKCNRTCRYCCNELPGAPQGIQIRNVGNLFNFFRFKKIVISGGEPMLFPDEVIMLAGRLKESKNIPIYMYSATFTKYTEDVLQHIDGITFSMHEDSTINDALRFRDFQNMIRRNPGKEYRLFIVKSMKLPLSVLQLDITLWDRIHIEGVKEEVCPRPENELLFELAEDWH